MPPSAGSLLACIHPTARLVCLVFVAVGLVYLAVIRLLRKSHPWPVTVAYIALLAGVLWFGSLRYSPLHFGGARFAVISGFEIRRSGRAPLLIDSGEIISASAGSPLVIHPLILPGPVDCMWSASTGGALDDPRSCDTTYAAPGGALFEILRLRIRPACGLPDASAQIKVSILP